MDSAVKEFISLEDLDADSFLLQQSFNSSLSNKSKQTSKNDKKIPLQEMSSTKEREAIVVRDLFYVLTGKEGLYIKYSDDVDESDVDKCLKGYTYRTSKDIDINFKEITKQLCHLGKYFSALSWFIKYFNKSYYGKVLTRFCEYLRNFLKEYQSTVCKFYEAFSTDSAFSLVGLYQFINNFGSETQLPSIYKTMEYLYDITQLLIEDNNKRLDDSNLLDMKFENIMKSLKEDMNTDTMDEVFIDTRNFKYVCGGLVLNIVFSHLMKYKGDDRSYTLFHNIYEFISIEYLEMLNQWLQYGKVNDPFAEFFIVESIRDNKHSIYNSIYWIDKYAIRREGLLKQFEPLHIQKQLFFTGKYLSIINECGCSDIAHKIPFTPIKSLQENNLDLLINEAYARSNQLIYQLLVWKYQMPNFLTLLNKYFLLTDGSLFEDFLNHSNHELKRSLGSASKSTITRSYVVAYERKFNTILEKMIFDLLEPKFERQSILEDILEIIKTQVTDANEILSASNLGKLTNLLKENVQSNTRLNSSDGAASLESQRCNKLAVSKFTIDLTIPFPLNQVVSESQKLEYQVIFRHSSLVKFMEKRFEKSWRELGYHSFWTWNFDDARVRKWIKRCRFIHTKMFDFIRIYLSYSKYDVIACNLNNVNKLLQNINNEGKHFDLSTFKSQITEFLSSSMSESLLSQAKPASCLYELFTLIIVFHEYVMSLRKALLLMDENLLNIYKEQLNLSLKYTDAQKEQKLDTLIRVVDTYHLTFQKKLTELCGYIGYYGEIDSPKMLSLHSKLVSSFRL